MDALGLTISLLNRGSLTNPQFAVFSFGPSSSTKTLPWKKDFLLVEPDEVYSEIGVTSWGSSAPNDYAYAYGGGLSHFWLIPGGRMSWHYAITTAPLEFGTDGITLTGRTSDHWNNRTVTYQIHRIQYYITAKYLPRTLL